MQKFYELHMEQLQDLVKYGNCEKDASLVLPEQVNSH